MWKEGEWSCWIYSKARKLYSTNKNCYYHQWLRRKTEIPREKPSNNIKLTLRLQRKANEPLKYKKVLKTDVTVQLHSSSILNKETDKIIKIYSCKDVRIWTIHNRNSPQSPNSNQRKYFRNNSIKPKYTLIKLGKLSSFPCPSCSFHVCSPEPRTPNQTIAVNLFIFVVIHRPYDHLLFPSWSWSGVEQLKRDEEQNTTQHQIQTATSAQHSD